MLTSRGPDVTLMLTSRGPDVTLMLTSRGPDAILAWQAARVAQATHGQYDAKAVWAASLALSRLRLAGGGRGCSQRQAGATEATAAAAAADDLSAMQWFGGALDSDGKFTHKGAPKGIKGRGGRGGRGAGAAAAAAAADGPSHKASKAVAQATDEAQREGQSCGGGVVASGADGACAAASEEGAQGWWSSQERALLAASVAFSLVSIVVASVRHAKGR